MYYVQIWQSSLIIQNIILNCSTNISSHEVSSLKENIKLHLVELLNLDEKILQIADRMLLEIHKIDVTLSKENYCLSFRNDIFSIRRLCGNVKTKYLLTKNNSSKVYVKYK